MTAKEEEKLKEIQGIQKRILAEVERICRKHELSFFLWAGTLLGAVRHEDIIPWDDDIDILMKRPDFDRFCAVCEKELSGEYVFLPPEYKNKFHALMTKIAYKNSRLHEPSEEDDFFDGMRNKITFDIFVLDNAYPGLLFRLQTGRIKMLYGYGIAHRYRIDYRSYSTVGKLCVKLLAKIGRHYSVKEIIEKLEKCAERSSRCRKYCRISNDQIKYLHHQYRQEWFENMISLQFGDKKYPAPARYHEILTYFYGDYMRLPPASERVPLHAEQYSQTRIW